MFEKANIWMRQNMKIELLNQLSEKDATNQSSQEFYIEKCKLSNVFKYILTKDKGIGGFEQINSSRPSNPIKHYKKFIDKTTRILNISKFIDSIFNTYNLENGTFVSPIDCNNDKQFSDYFMKGRKEGNNNSTKNYYNESIEYTVDNKYNFKCLGRIIMCIYDVITFQMASSDKIPLSFDDKTDIEKKKTDILKDYIKHINLDVLFITEYVDKNTFGKIDGYNVVLGEVVDELCNAIIYKNTFGNFSIGSYISENSSEFKETPLVLENQSYLLVCFHGGGKGILENVSKFTDTDLYKYVNKYNKKVILGGDFNCDIYKDCEIFGEKSKDNIEITTYKQRTSVQPQFDKTNKKDRTKKDDFVFKNCEIINCFVTMQDVNRNKLVNKHCDDSFLIPNQHHPFDHYFVNYTIKKDSSNENSNKSKTDNTMCSSFFKFLKGLCCNCRNSQSDN